jgi:DNA-binding beta-propeller fold protein YncE
MNTHLLSTLLLLCAATLTAQVRHITTDKSPSTLLADPDGLHVHVLTAGSDRNFNGAFEPDSGDVAPRWFVIDSQSDAIVDSLTFEGFFNSFPLRVGVDTANRVLYVAQLGRIRAFDMNRRTLLRDTVAPGSYSGVSFEPLSGSVLGHMRTSFTTRGYVVAMDPESGDTLGIFQAGFNPQMSISTIDFDTRGPAVYTLNEGTFTQPDASISYASGNNDIYRARHNKALGGGAMHVTTLGTTAFVVMNGTHEVRMIDTRQHRELPLSPIQVGTSGFDGPRSVAILDEAVLLVPTYSGDLRRFIIATGAMFDSIPLPGKGEAVAVSRRHAFVAIKYGLGGTGYDADSIVAVVDLATAAVIDTIPVGLDPGALFIDRRGDLHVIGYGLNDTTRWWMTFDGVTYQQKHSRRLHGSLGFPLRVAYHEAGDSLYIVLSDSLFAFSAASPDAASRLVYVDSTAAGDFSGVTLAGDDLLVTELPLNFSPDAGYVHIVGIDEGRRSAKFRAGSFLNGAVEVASPREHARTFYALNEGAFGGPNSTLSLYQYSENILGGDSLGKGANHLTTTDGGVNLLATMNGDHQLVLIDALTWGVAQRIPTGTSGFDGPREAMQTWSRGGMPVLHYAATTYAGDLRFIHSSGEVFQTYQTGGRAEGFVKLEGRKYYVANALTPTYAPDSTVAVIDIPASVERIEDAATRASLEQNHPNPAIDRTGIRFTIKEREHVELALYDLQGQLLKTLAAGEMEPGTYSAQLTTTALPAGTYIYVLRAGESIESRMMEVVR